VLKEGRVYVPKDEKLRVEIIQLHHDTLIVSRSLTVDSAFIFSFP